MIVLILKSMSRKSFEVYVVNKNNEEMKFQIYIENFVFTLQLIIVSFYLNLVMKLLKKK